MEPAPQRSGNLIKHGRGLDHSGRNSVYANGADITLGINERVIFVRRFPSLWVQCNHSDFYDTVMSPQARGLTVDHGKVRYRSLYGQWFSPRLPSICGTLSDRSEEDEYLSTWLVLLYSPNIIA